jgi:hypothetical protein
MGARPALALALFLCDNCDLYILGVTITPYNPILRGPELRPDFFETAYNFGCLSLSGKLIRAFLLIVRFVVVFREFSWLIQFVHICTSLQVLLVFPYQTSF